MPERGVSGRIPRRGFAYWQPPVLVFHSVNIDSMSTDCRLRSTRVGMLTAHLQTKENNESKGRL